VGGGASVFAISFLLSSSSDRDGPAVGHHAWRGVPNFPGSLNQLNRKYLREILSTLDFDCAWS
jgi:hypothetical protein